MFRRRLPVIGLLVLASLAATARRSSAQPLLGEYAVLGLQRTVLRPGARVTAGAVGTAGGTLVLRNHVRIGGTVAADMIRLDNDATASRFFCRFVVLSHGGGAVGGPVVGGGALPGCRAFTPPLVDPTLLAPVAVVPGWAARRRRRHRVRAVGDGPARTAWQLSRVVHRPRRLGGAQRHGARRQRVRQLTV